MVGRNKTLVARDFQFDPFILVNPKKLTDENTHLYTPRERKKGTEIGEVWLLLDIRTSIFFSFSSTSFAVFFSPCSILLQEMADRSSTKKLRKEGRIVVALAARVFASQCTVHTVKLSFPFPSLSLSVSS